MHTTRRVVLVVAIVAAMLTGASRPDAAAVTPCSAGNVALTFDDGPRPGRTDAILDVLAREQAHATFFVVGRSVSYFPDLVARAAREGHQVANHTWNHPALSILSDAAVRDELVRTSDEIARRGGGSPTLMRPPYGAVNARVRAVAASLGLATVLWTVDPQDWRTGRSASTITSFTLSALHPGAIVLLHDGTANAAATVAALPAIIDGIRARGYCIGRLDAAGQVRPDVPTMRIGDRRVVEGPQGTSTVLTLPVRLSHPTSSQVSAAWRTTGGRATPGTDYVAASGRVTFPPGATTASIQVRILGDDLDEPRERFRVVLSDAVGATFARRIAIGTIVDDDRAPRVSVHDARVVESQQVVLVPVRLDAPSGRTVSAVVRTTAGTARKGIDFVGRQKTFVMRPGRTEQNLRVTIRDRLGENGNRWFRASIVQTSNLVVRRRDARVTIVDDLLPVASAPATVTAREGGRGYAGIAVSLSRKTLRPVEVVFATRDRTAVAGVQYVRTSGTLEFRPGVDLRRIRVPLLDDTVDLGSSTFDVLIGPPTNALPRRHVVTHVKVLDDD
jgi:peptidoglycan-N-acetylglucosamine deacetylase